MKHWQSLEHLNTGEPLGIMCIECSERHEGEAVMNDFESIKENLFMTCMCCDKMVNEDYSVCGECLEVYPKGHDERVDNNMKCFCCSYGI